MDDHLIEHALEMINRFLLQLLLTLSAHAPEGYSSHLVCLSVVLSICQYRISAITWFLTLSEVLHESRQGKLKKNTFLIGFEKKGPNRTSGHAQSPADPVIFGKHGRIVSTPFGSLTTPRLSELVLDSSCASSRV